MEWISKNIFIHQTFCFLKCVTLFVKELYYKTLNFLYVLNTTGIHLFVRCKVMETFSVSDISFYWWIVTELRKFWENNCRHILLWRFSQKGHFRYDQKTEWVRSVLLLVICSRKHKICVKFKFVEIFCQSFLQNVLWTLQ